MALRTVADIGPEHEYTKLRPNLEGVDPDDAFSKIPYEKGSLFLFYLENQVGGPTAMLEWINAYYTKFEGKSINTETFKAEFIDYFQSRAGDKIAAIDWDVRGLFFFFFPFPSFSLPPVLEPLPLPLCPC